MSIDVRTITATRIEKLAESFEELALGIAAKQISRSRSTDGTTPAILDTFLDEARTGMRKALREFLAPIVRLAEGGPVQEQPEEGPRCAECLRHSICGNPRCEHWANAIRARIKDHTGDAA